MFLNYHILPTMPCARDMYDVSVFKSLHFRNLVSRISLLPDPGNEVAVFASWAPFFDVPILNSVSVAIVTTHQKLCFYKQK